ncbi:hypothetical protein BDQ17DRAFT_313886 [Cyathus striatus]|nr:hypothetical protein BDQ17DRAFT_313886 [Cyathus striatus]
MLFRLLKLRSRLSNYCNYRGTQHCLIAPIRRLPDELLGIIFSYICQGTIDIATTEPDSIWTLQGVCVCWRDILQGTSSLLSGFTIDTIGDTNIPEPANVIRRIQSCLKHSGKAPLSIYLQPPSEKFCDEFPISVIEDIAAHSDRWTSFSIEASIFNAIKKTEVFTATSTKYYNQT